MSGTECKINYIEYQKDIRRNLINPVMKIMDGMTGYCPTFVLFDTVSSIKRKDAICPICKSSICLADLHRKEVGHGARENLL